MSDEPPVLDASMIAALRAFGRVPGLLLDDMLRSFLVEAPALLDEITAAAGDGDAAAGRAVHRLKGASGFIGASRLTAACIDFEHGAEHGDPDGREPALAAVRHEVARAEGAAQQLLEGSS